MFMLRAHRAQPSLPKAEVMTLRPQEPDEAITDGGDFHDDSRALEIARPERGF
jgi:hypothetical protein